MLGRLMRVDDGIREENLQVVIILLRAIAFLDLKYSIFVTIYSILIGHFVP
jgi:hypothetical protein